MNDQAKGAPSVVSVPLSGPVSREPAGAPDGALRISGDLIREALLGEGLMPPDSPLKLGARGARLVGMIIEGGLDLSSIKFDRPIVFERCTCLGPILLTQARLDSVSLAHSRAPQLDAQRAAIAGELDLRGLRLESPGGVALDAANIHVGGTIWLSDGFTARGAVNLRSASIGGDLSLIGAVIQHPYPGTRRDFTGARDPRQAALNANAARIDGNVYVEHCDIEGLAYIAAARIGMNFFLRHSAITSGGSWCGLVLGSTEACDLVFANVRRFEGSLLLRGASCRHLGDDGTLWREGASLRPRPGVELELDQFRYESLLDAPVVRTDVSWQARLAWLKAQPAEYWSTDFRAQPFTHLAEVLRNMGDAHGSRMILFERERLRLKAKTVGLFEKLGGHVMGALAGYGYKTHYALFWAIGIWLLGAVIFGVASRLGEMRPADPHVLAEAHYQETLHPPTDYEPVSPLIYSADILLPIVELGQQEYWIPRNAGERASDAATAFPRLAAPAANAVNWLFGGWLAKAYYYFEIAMGWLLVSIVIAGFSGLLGHAREE